MVKLRSNPLSLAASLESLQETSESLSAIAENIANFLNPNSRKRKRMPKKSHPKIIDLKNLDWAKFGASAPNLPARTLGDELTDADADTTTDMINTPIPALMQQLLQQASGLNTIIFFSVGSLTPLHNFLNNQPPDIFAGLPSKTSNTLSKKLQIGYATPRFAEFLSVNSLHLDESDIAQLYNCIVKHTQNHFLLHGLKGNDAKKTVLLMLAIEFFLNYEKLFSADNDSNTTQKQIIHHFQNGQLQYLKDNIFDKDEIRMAICLASRLACYEIKMQKPNPDIDAVEQFFIKEQNGPIQRMPVSMSMPNVAVPFSTPTPTKPRTRERIKPLPPAISAPSLSTNGLTTPQSVDQSEVQNENSISIDIEEDESSLSRLLHEADNSISMEMGDDENSISRLVDEDSGQPVRKKRKTETTPKETTPKLSIVTFPQTSFECVNVADNEDLSASANQGQRGAPPPPPPPLPPIYQPPTNNVIAQLKAKKLEKAGLPATPSTKESTNIVNGITDFFSSGKKLNPTPRKPDGQTPTPPPNPVADELRQRLANGGGLKQASERPTTKTKNEQDSLFDKIKSQKVETPPPTPEWKRKIKGRRKAIADTPEKPDNNNNNNKGQKKWQ